MRTQWEMDSSECSQYMSHKCRDSTDPCHDSRSLDSNLLTLTQVFSEHRRSMTFKRKALLIQVAFEKDLTHKFRDERKTFLMRRFNVYDLIHVVTAFTVHFLGI